MSPTDSISGEVRTRSLRALSWASVKTPDEPPLNVQVPWISGGISAVPWLATLGSLGKFELPSMAGFCGSKVGLPMEVGCQVRPPSSERYRPDPQAAKHRPSRA